MKGKPLEIQSSTFFLEIGINNNVTTVAKLMMKL